jgi:uncharacterized glyoxalase superfamily protein PhnB
MNQGTAFGKVTPILRMFDVGKTKEFYLDFLGFQVDWEHRYEEGLPLYMQISRGECILHLSEHYGDGSPGAAIRIEVSGIERLHAGLIAKSFKFARPGLETTPWGSKEMTVTDPSGNRLNLYEQSR